MSIINFAYAHEVQYLSKYFCYFEINTILKTVKITAKTRAEEPIIKYGRRNGLLTFLLSICLVLYSYASLYLCLPSFLKFSPKTTNPKAAVSKSPDLPISINTVPRSVDAAPAKNASPSDLNTMYLSNPEGIEFARKTGIKIIVNNKLAIIQFNNTFFALGNMRIVYIKDRENDTKN